jgi:hypothetical protein
MLNNSNSPVKTNEHDIQTGIEKKHSNTLYEQKTKTRETIAK